MKLSDLPRAPTAAAAAGFLLLFSLGTWQLQRLHQKEAQIEQLDRMYAANPALTSFSEDMLSNPNGGIIRGMAEGEINYSADVLVGPRTNEDGQPGYHVITPLTLADGATLFVNRGWVLDTAAVDFLMSDDRRPTEHVRVFGIAHTSPRPPMALENDPAGGHWYWIEIPRMAERFRLRRPVPYVLNSEIKLGRQGTELTYPLPLPKMPYPPNNHMIYVMTWYSLAFALFVIYFLRFLQPIIIVDMAQKKERLKAEAEARDAAHAEANAKAEQAAAELAESQALAQAQLLGNAPATAPAAPVRTGRGNHGVPQAKPVASMPAPGTPKPPGAPGSAAPAAAKPGAPGAPRPAAPAGAKPAGAVPPKPGAPPAKPAAPGAPRPAGAPPAGAKPAGAPPAKPAAGAPPARPAGAPPAKPAAPGAAKPASPAAPPKKPTE